MYASVKGHVSVAKLLLQKGADVNAVEKSGGTALMLLLVKVRLNSQTLLERGPNANITEKTGKTALSLALVEEA